MILANISDYVYPWQLGLLAAFLLAWLVGGSYLMKAALARIPDLPKNQRSMNRAFTINFFAGGAALAAMAVICGFLYVLGQRMEFQLLAFGGAVAGPILFLLMAWVVMLSMLNMPAAQVLRIMLRSSGIVLVATMLLGAGAFLPAYSMRQANAKVGVCSTNLYHIRDALGEFSSVNPGRMPASLQDLVSANLIDKKYIQCPAGAGEDNYVYVPYAGSFPQKDDKTAPKRVVVADKHGNHKNKNLILYSTGLQDLMPDREFTQLLNRPENKDFKAAYEKAK